MSEEQAQVNVPTAEEIAAREPLPPWHFSAKQPDGSYHATSPHGAKFRGGYDDRAIKIEVQISEEKAPRTIWLPVEICRVMIANLADDYDEHYSE